MPDKDAQAIITLLQEARMQVITNPLSNLYVKGIDGRHPEGITRVDDLLAAGIPVAMGSDNTHDVFCPMGSADMLQAALFLAYQTRTGNLPLIRTILTMATITGAQILHLDPSYGLEPGCAADLVILDAKTPETALIQQRPRLYVIKRGQLVAKAGHLVNP